MMKDPKIIKVLRVGVTGKMGQVNVAKKLANTTFVYFLANFSTKILSFLLLPLYTSKLSPEEYGSVDLVFTVSQFLIPVVSLTIYAAAFRYLIDAKTFEEKRSIISCSFLTLLFSSVIAVGVSMIGYGAVGNIYILLGGIYIVTSAWSNYLLQMYRGLQHNKTYAFMGVANAAIHIVLNVVFIAGLNMGSISLLVSPIIGFVITTVVLFLSNGFYKNVSLRSFDPKTIKTLLKYSLPIIPENMIWWCLSGFSKFYLSYVHGSGLLGIYSVANKFSDFLTSLYSIFHLAWTEIAYQSYNDKGRNELYSIAYNKILRVMLSVVMVLIPLTRVCVPAFLDEAYMLSINYMPVLYIMTFINIISTFYGAGFQCAKKTMGVLIASSIGAGTNILFSLLLVSHFKVWGTITAIFLANIALLICKKTMSKRFFEIQVNYKNYFILFPVAIFMLVFYLGGIWTNVASCIVAILIAVIVNLDIVKGILNILKTKTIKGK